MNGSVKRSGVLTSCFFGRWVFTRRSPPPTQAEIHRWEIASTTVAAPFSTSGTTVSLTASVAGHAQNAPTAWRTTVAPFSSTGVTFAAIIIPKGDDQKSSAASPRAAAAPSLSDATVVLATSVGPTAADPERSRTNSSAADRPADDERKAARERDAAFVVTMFAVFSAAAQAQG